MCIRITTTASSIPSSRSRSTTWANGAGRRRRQRNLRGRRRTGETTSSSSILEGAKRMAQTNGQTNGIANDPRLGKRAATPYAQFVEKEGVPVHTGSYVADLYTAEVGPWAR